MADTAVIESQPETETKKESEMSTPMCLGACLFVWMGPLCILAGVAVLITAISTAHWVEYEEGGEILLEGGLFKMCFPHRNNTCRDWDDDLYDTDNLKVAIAAYIIATIGYVIGFVIMTCFAISIMAGDGVGLGGHVSWLAAAGINITGVTLFNKFKNQTMSLKGWSPLSDSDYGWSFHLSWGAIILVVVGCCFSILMAICCGDGEPENEAAPVELVSNRGTDNPVRQDIYSNPESGQAMTYTSVTETVKVS